MVKRHHLALPKEQPRQTEAQHEPAPKGKVTKPEPEPKSAPAKHPPELQEKSAPPQGKKADNSHGPEPKAKNTAEESEEKPEAKTAPTKNPPKQTEKPAPNNEKQGSNSHPAEPKGKPSAKEREQQQEPEAKSAPKTAPTKEIPVKSTPPTEKQPAKKEPAEKEPSEKNPAQPKGKQPSEPKEQEPVEPKGKGSAEPMEKEKAEPKGKQPIGSKGKEPAETKGKKAAEQPEQEPEQAPTKKGPTTAPTKSSPSSSQKKPAKQSEEQEQEELYGKNSKGKQQEPKERNAVPFAIPSKFSSSQPALKSSYPPSKNSQSAGSHYPPPHQVSSSSSSQPKNSESKILGISTAFLINLAIILVVVAIVAFIIYKLYQRYRTRQDYNETPENFAHKPVLGFNQEYYLSHTKIQRVIAPERITIDEQNPINGKIWQVEFKGTEKSAVYFHRRQNTTAYFQVEVLSVHGAIEIGFVPVSSFAQLKSGEENIGNSGVGVTNSGYIQAQGENIYNYSWILVYGDVFGIGLTRQNSKFSERRAWISKNGVLLNYPPNDEMDRWLATIEISAEQKAEYNLGTEKKENEEQEQEKEDEQKAKQKMQRQKIEGLLKKQRISLKTFNKFQYYPVIVCHGNKDENASTIINVNVGGQVFRMFDAQFRSGLLKDKSLFGDD